MTLINQQIQQNLHLYSKDLNLSEKSRIFIVLDNIRSGLNIGSIFRTSDAFLVQKILICGNSAIPPHKEILKTALGATESVNWEYYSSTLEACLNLKKEGIKLLAIEQSEHSIPLHLFIPDPEQSYALILGNEVDGVDQKILEICDAHLEIPQFGTKHSLNVSVAHGMAIWQIASHFIQE